MQSDRETFRRCWRRDSPRSPPPGRARPGAPYSHAVLGEHRGSAFHRRIAEKAGGIYPGAEPHYIGAPLEFWRVISHQETQRVRTDVDCGSPHSGSRHAGLRLTPVGVSATQGMVQFSGSIRRAVSSPTGLS